jgi:hypothetical protein
VPRPTIELSDRQIHGLIHGPTQDDLEAELELIDAHPNVFPDATPESLPRISVPRLAHTQRRGSGELPVVLAPAARTSTSANPDDRRRTSPAMPCADSAALARANVPSTERPTMPAIPRLSAAALASLEAASPRATPPEALPPVDLAVTEPALVAAMPKPPIVRASRHAWLVFPTMLVVLVLGAVAVWLR